MTTNQTKYRTSVVPLPDFSDIILAPRAEPARTPKPQTATHTPPAPPKPASESRKPVKPHPSPSLPAPSHEPPDSLLRDLLNHQSMVIIEARAILSQLTKDLVVGNKPAIKASLIALNNALGTYPDHLAQVRLVTKNHEAT